MKNWYNWANIENPLKINWYEETNMIKHIILMARTQQLKYINISEIDKDFPCLIFFNNFALCLFALSKNYNFKWMFMISIFNRPIKIGPTKVTRWLTQQRECYFSFDFMSYSLLLLYARIHNWKYFRFTQYIVPVHFDFSPFFSPSHRGILSSLGHLSLEDMFFAL